MSSFDYRESPNPAATTGPLSSELFDSDFAYSPKPAWVPGSIPHLPTDRYTVIEEIQHGGMGVIYNAVDRDLCRSVAIKILRDDRVGCSMSLAEFATEAHIMSFLAHPGITPIYDRGHSNDGRPFHVMKLIEGETLSTLIRQRELSTTRRLSIFAHVCETMAFAHSRDVLHLDIKPGNVMIGPYGEINVMDWGMARCGMPASQISTMVNPVTNKHRIGGTPAYMAPEQARGIGVDSRTDVFGLGCLLCELLTNEPPYVTQNLREAYQVAAMAHLEPALERLDQCEADPRVIRLAKKCLQVEPDERFCNAIEIATQVADYQESSLLRIRTDMDRFFELSLDLFCIADFHGFYKRVNANFMRVLGYTETELLTRPFLHYIHQEDQQRTIEKMSVLREGQPVARFRNRYRTRKGNYVELEWTAKSIAEEGIIFAVARDVSTEGDDVSIC